MMPESDDRGADFDLADDLDTSADAAAAPAPPPAPAPPTEALAQAKAKLDELRLAAEGAPNDTDLAAQLHRQHYTVADLERQVQAQTQTPGPAT